MSSVPFLYINVIAMCCYALMFTAFLAAKKNAEIRSFIMVLLGFMFWTGGSILMRLQVFPGVDFWYYVSIMALFSIALLLYFFACSFARVKGHFLKIVWSIGTLIILAITPTGLFLSPPEIVELSGGGIGFTYKMDAWIAVPALFAVLVLVSIGKIFFDVIKSRGIRTPGLPAILIGCAIVLVGNLLQLIPGNVFPWDTLSGIIFAVMLMYSLYSKRMFRLTLLVSRQVVVVISALICVTVSGYFVVPMENQIIELLSISEDSASAVVLVIFIAMLAGVYTLLSKLIDALFTREEQQGRLIESFSTAVTSSLDINAVLELLVNTVKTEIAVEDIYICLPEGEAYVVRHSSSPLASTAIRIRGDGAFLQFIRESSPCFSLDEFESSPSYMSMWEEEKNLFRNLGLECVLSLKNGEEIVGLVLLSEKERRARYSYGELSFLSTVGSIAAIAVKNASLYEQVYREARIDALTGVFNYKHFVEKVDEEYRRTGNECLSLLFVDLDDFNLYNKLNGARAGDRVLKCLADMLTRSAGEVGTVYRYSGKVFALLLPGFDGRRTETLAREISRKVEGIDKNQKLTVSCGICVSPHAASSPKELIENADLAVYQAKAAGKGGIMLFKGQGDAPVKVAQRAYEIIHSVNDDERFGDASGAIKSMLACIEGSDNYTGGHCRRVVDYAAILATGAGLPDDQIRMIIAAAQLHDIGKISIDGSILNKNGRLTDEEFKIMNGHVNSAINMMRHLPSMDYLVPLVLGHHERWDGKGYPRGTAGTDIPIGARCLAVADSFDAMTSDRPYRKGMPLEDAVAQIEANAGTQFDPELARIFVELVRAKEITIIE